MICCAVFSSPCDDAIRGSCIGMRHRQPLLLLSWHHVLQRSVPMIKGTHALMLYMAHVSDDMQRFQLLCKQYSVTHVLQTCK